MLGWYSPSFIIEHQTVFTEQQLAEEIAHQNTGDGTLFGLAFR